MTHRIWAIMAGLAAIGTVVAAVLQGWRGAAGFLVGSAFSFVTFFGYKRMVDRVGGDSMGSGSIALVLLKYSVFTVVAYVIFRFSEISIPAALAGCFVVVAAVVLEILYELIYAP